MRWLSLMPLKKRCMILMLAAVSGTAIALQSPGRGVSQTTSLAASSNYHSRQARRDSVNLKMNMAPQPSLEEIDSISSGYVNGHSMLQKLDGLNEANVPLDPGALLPEAPPVSFSKFLTMQEKRAVVTIRYSEDAGLKPYFLTMAQKIKNSHPDVIVERRILPSVDDGEATFEVVVDGKVVIGKSRHRKVGRGVEMPQNSGQRRSIFVSMGELDLAISRARRKQRPTTAYGDEGDSKKTKRGS